MVLCCDAGNLIFAITMDTKIAFNTANKVKLFANPTTAVLIPEQRTFIDYPASRLDCQLHILGSQSLPAEKKSDINPGIIKTV